MSTRVPNEELPILEALINIRNRLHALKQDRQNYIKVQAVTEIYDEVTEQVTKLNDLREKATEPPTKDNRVNDVLDDVFQLLSLFFIRVGKSRESPATYAQLATIKQCLEHLNESGVYTQDEISAYQNRLNEFRKIIYAERDEVIPEPQMKLLKRKLVSCEMVLNQLLESVSNMSEELVPIHQSLVEIKRNLGAIGAKGEIEISDIIPYQNKLRAIDSKRVDGKFLSSDGSIPSGQGQVIGLLEECYEDAHELIACQNNVAEFLRPLYDRLIDLKSQLERLVLTHRWSLRETDLWSYQSQLTKIDNMRKDGKFYDDEGNIPEGQATLLYLLHKCYRLVYKLLSSSEPIAEPLIPIHNQLRTVRKLLLEVKKLGGPFTTRELYHYQMKLASIDNLRKDGKFLDTDGSVPEGQGIVMALLNECYDILFEMKTDMEEEE
ncbi:46540_t:CDS:2 [Gigaspora margarita]|uniref:46540_t:CDS:1 n=1 Tax=Gigaspora margarita TaxID=4874 RepID=A0ABN7W575_GIGMA|nr:46540_t:CDS:2 [Gigaspora margarita]